MNATFHALIGTYGIKLLISLLPFFIGVIIVAVKRNQSIREQEEIKRRYNMLNQTIAEKNIAQFQMEEKPKTDFLSQLKSEMNILGIEYKFENLSLILIALFIGGALLVQVLIGGGILLMLYFGSLAIFTLYVFVLNQMDKKRKDLKEEFMSKLRDIASEMSVGLNLQTAIGESLNASNTSIVMAREMEAVKDAIITGAKYSDAFMKMYSHLKIKEIKEFAQMCYVYEETGGKFVNIIHSFEDGYKMKRKVGQEAEVFEASMKTDQKVIVGVPVLCIVGFAIFMPSVVRSFYGSWFGQIFGIVIFSLIYAGTLFMSRFIKVGGDE